jgi:hypothetical protein
MQARVVPLDSRQAGDSFVEGSPSQRVALVAELSRRAWALTGFVPTRVRRCPYA